jgi:hypothetical protein
MARFDEWEEYDVTVRRIAATAAADRTTRHLQDGSLETHVKERTCLRFYRPGYPAS